MLEKHRIVWPVLLLSGILASACDDHGPIGPSATPGPSPSPPPAPVTETWNIVVRMTSATGGECVGDMMRSQVGMPKRYSLAITQMGSKVNVTLRSMSGDYACTFAGGRAEPDGFAFGPTDGYFSCEVGGAVRGYTCANGVRRDMFAIGQNLFGHISGDQITGSWDVGWDVTSPENPSMSEYLETTALYTGTR